MRKYDKYREISEFIGMKPINTISTMKKANPAKFLLLNIAMEHKEEIVKNAEKLHPYILQIKDGEVVAKYQTLDDLPEHMNYESVVYCIRGKKHYKTYLGFTWEYDI